MASIISVAQIAAVLTAVILTAICLISTIKIQVEGCYQAQAKNLDHNPVGVVPTQEPRRYAQAQPAQQQVARLASREQGNLSRT